MYSIFFGDLSSLFKACSSWPMALHYHISMENFPFFAILLLSLFPLKFALGLSEFLIAAFCIIFCIPICT